MRCERAALLGPDPFHPERSGLAVAFILARNWGRSCFSWNELPIGAKGGSPRTVLRDSPDLGPKGRLGLEERGNRTSKRESCS